MYNQKKYDFAAYVTPMSSKTHYWMLQAAQTAINTYDLNQSMLSALNRYFDAFDHFYYDYDAWLDDANTYCRHLTVDDNVVYKHLDTIIDLYTMVVNRLTTLDDTSYAPLLDYTRAHHLRAYLHYQAAGLKPSQSYLNDFFMQARKIHADKQAIALQHAVDYVGLQFDDAEQKMYEKLLRNQQTQHVAYVPIKNKIEQAMRNLGVNNKMWDIGILFASIASCKFDEFERDNWRKTFD